MEKPGRKKRILILAILAIIVCFVIAIVTAILVGLNKSSTTPAPEVPTNNFHPSTYKIFSSYAVSSDSGVCSQIGKSIFQKNGSAVDVAIATMLCIGVVNPHSCGIGGGHLAIIYDTPRNETKKVLTTLVARERAPINATSDMFTNSSSQIGGLAIAVPGEVKGLYAAWEKFGRLPWSELIDPTAQLLENGFQVEKALANAIKVSETIIMNTPNLRSTYTKSNGALLGVGDILKDHKLAMTFRNISANPNAYYEGSLAKDIVQEIQAQGGIITEEDLKTYKVEWKDPTAIKLQGTNLTHHSLRPPSSGIVVGLILNVMAGYKLQPGDFSKDNLTLTYHRLVEAFKFSYAGRSLLGDENFVNVTQLLKQMSSSSFAENIRSKIEDNITYDNVSHYGNIYAEFNDHGTAHLNVYGPDGSAVAITSTINTMFGSTVKGPMTGILYNNEMDDFSSPNFSNYYGYVPSISNYIKPRKIPMSSMSPTFVMDSQGNVKFISGASDGSKIITAIAGVITNGLWSNETLDRSVDRPRLHHQLLPNTLIYDDWLDKVYIDGLKSKGHAMVPYAITAICNNIKINCVGERCIEAVSDGRKGGQPDGL